MYSIIISYVKFCHSHTFYFLKLFIIVYSLCYANPKSKCLFFKRLLEPLSHPIRLIIYNFAVVRRKTFRRSHNLLFTRQQRVDVIRHNLYIGVPQIMHFFIHPMLEPQIGQIQPRRSRPKHGVYRNYIQSKPRF